MLHLCLENLYVTAHYPNSLSTKQVELLHQDARRKRKLDNLSQHNRRTFVSMY